MSITLLSTSASLDPRIKQAIAKARSLSEQGKEDLATKIWHEIEELRTKIAEQKAAIKTDFDRYCEDNPSAVGCLIYDV